jgi:hypothetical protein
VNAETAEAGEREILQMRLLTNPDFAGADFNFYRLASAFAALREPRTERFGVSLRLHAKAGFDASIGDGKHIIEFGGVREVSHAEAIEPIERTKLALAGDNNFNREFLRVHFASITSSMTRSARRKPARNNFGDAHGTAHWLLLHA